MPNASALASAMKAGVMTLMIVGMGAAAAVPAQRGFVKPPDSLSSLAHAETHESRPAGPVKPSVLNPRTHYLKRWLLNAKEDGLDGTAKSTDKTTTKATMTASHRTDRRAKTGSRTASPDKRAQMLRMISALEELHRTINSTLSSRITIIPRANGKNSGKKNKVLPAAGGALNPTTAPPAAVSSTASRASADVIIPSLTGRNFKKSLPPQPKKTNKRVCFWKYCSQN